MLRVFKPWLDYLLLSAFILIIYSLFLGAHPLMVPDEGRYSEVAREMLLQHQWLTPQLNGVDFFDKPILFYWLQALAMALFGVNEWAIRLFPMLFGWLGILMVFSTCRQLFDRSTAWRAALILASCPLYYFLAHYANLDLEVAVWVTVSLCSFIRAYCPEQRDFYPGWLYVAYITAGLAVLTKGLIGLYFPIMIIGLWIMVTRQWFLVTKMRLPTGLILVCIIVLPWFILVENKNPGFNYYFFYIQQVLRFLAKSFNNVQPVWFYVPIVLIGIFPWAGLLWPTLHQAFQKRDAYDWFMVLWTASILIFFSIPHSKLIGYIVPITPPLAILIARYYPIINVRWQRYTTWSYLLVLLLLVVAAILIPHQWRMTYGITPTLRSMVVISSLFLVAFLYGLSQQKLLHLFSAWIVTNFIVFNLLWVGFFLINPTIASTYFPTKALVKQIKPFMQKDTQLVAFFIYPQDLPLYAGQNVLMVNNWDTPGLAQQDNWHGEFTYAMQYLQPSAKEVLINSTDFQTLWSHSKRLLVFIKTKHLDELQAKVGPVCIVATQDAMMVVSNDKQLCSLPSHLPGPGY